jgi:hypothetical protein
MFIANQPYESSKTFVRFENQLVVKIAIIFR